MRKELTGDVSSEPGRGVTVCKDLPGDVSSEHQSARAEMGQWQSGVNYLEVWQTKGNYLEQVGVRHPQGRSYLEVWQSEQEPEMDHSGTEELLSL